MFYYEMLCQIPLTVAEKRDNILCVGNEEEINKELKKHKLNAEFLSFEDAKEAINTTEPKYDLIISEENLYALDLSRALSEKGVYVTKCNALPDVDMMADLGKYFYIVMPYSYIDEDGKVNYLIFASKKFHPVSDISRHIADFLDGNEYYNVDTHTASFSYPEFLFKKIKNVLKI
jgi:spermidine synthase